MFDRSIAKYAAAHAVLHKKQRLDLRVIGHNLPFSAGAVFVIQCSDFDTWRQNMITDPIAEYHAGFLLIPEYRRPELRRTQVPCAQRLPRRITVIDFRAIVP